MSVVSEKQRIFKKPSDDCTEFLKPVTAQNGDSVHLPHRLWQTVCHIHNVELDAPDGLGGSQGDLEEIEELMGELRASHYSAEAYKCNLEESANALTTLKEYIVTLHAAATADAKDIERLKSADSLLLNVSASRVAGPSGSDHDSTEVTMARVSAQVPPEQPVNAESFARPSTHTSNTEGDERRSSTSANSSNNAAGHSGQCRQNNQHGSRPPEPEFIPDKGAWKIDRSGGDGATILTNLINNKDVLCKFIARLNFGKFAGGALKTCAGKSPAMIP